MSVAQAVLDDLIELLAAAGPARPVLLSDPADGEPLPVVGLRVVALDRVGRSQRNGPLLDLALVVDVITTGPDALTHTEQLLVALERTAWTVSARPAGPPASSLVPVAGLAPIAGLGFGVQFTFSVPVTPDGPPPATVQHPPEAQIRVSSERSPAW